MAGIKDFEQFGGGGGMKFLDFQEASDSATVEFLNMEFFNTYFVRFSEVRPQLTDYLKMQMSNDGGSTWFTIGYESAITVAIQGSTGFFHQDETEGWILSRDADWNTSNHTINGSLWISPRGAQKPWVNGTVSYYGSGPRYGFFGGIGSSTGVDSLRFLFDTQTMTSGKFFLYGMLNS